MSDIFLRAMLTAFLGGLKGSTENWSPGDLAICIAEEWSVALPGSPKKDDLLRVSHVCMGGLFLHFHGKPDAYHWQAHAFRKIQPDTKAADDEAWIDCLKPVKRRTDA